MSENKRYYWLKLKEDFFEDDTVQWLEEQDNGKDYVIFYLKLCLKSLQDDGKLIRYVGEKLIPYDIRALGKLTNTSLDTVAVAMKTFIDIGLIEQLETGEIYLTQINEMIGSETDSAKRMRKKRILESKKTQKLPIPSQCDTNVHKSDTEIEIDKELEKDKELKLDQEQKTVKINDNNDKYNPFTFYQENGFGTIAPLIRDKIVAIHNDFKEIGSSSYDADHLIIKALEMAVTRNIRNWAYAEKILINWNNKGFKTVMDVDASEKQFQASKNRGTHTFISEEASKTTEELLENSRKRLAADVANTSEEDFSLFR